MTEVTAEGIVKELILGRFIYSIKILSFQEDSNQKKKKRIHFYIFCFTSEFESARWLLQL